MTTKAEPTATPKERKTVTIDLTDHPELFEHITKAADKDERTPSQWTRRYLAEMLHQIKTEKTA